MFWRKSRPTTHISTGNERIAINKQHHSACAISTSKSRPYLPSYAPRRPGQSGPEKTSGAVVGTAGSNDYACIQRVRSKQSGCIGVGGDTSTNDFPRTAHPHGPSRKCSRSRRASASGQQHPLPTTVVEVRTRLAGKRSRARICSLTIITQPAPARRLRTAQRELERRTTSTYRGAGMFPPGHLQLKGITDLAEMSSNACATLPTPKMWPAYQRFRNRSTSTKSAS